MLRRRFLQGVVGVGACLGRAASALATARQRAVIVGGGWAGLSAARELRQQAPNLDVCVIDRDEVLRALPLSNPWLVGRTPERLPRLNRATLAANWGYRFLAADVLNIERSQREIHTSQGLLSYDWLLVAPGLGYDYHAWFGDDHRSAAMARDRFPAGFQAQELDVLRKRLLDYRGGDLVMTIPAPPYRCPPAPYERAMMLGWWLKTQRIPGRLIVLDATGGLPRFTRLFSDRFPVHIEHRPFTVIRGIDLHKQKVVTDDDELRFAHAMLLPSMVAPPVVAQADLLGHDARGAASAWAVVEPLSLRATADERVFFAGDLVGPVSPLFGHYPKTAHMAARQGVIAARQIALQSGALERLPTQLPQSVCHVWLDAEPGEQMRMEAQYRQRADGIIAQSLTQHDNPQPRGEDLLWGLDLYAHALGAPM